MQLKKKQKPIRQTLAMATATLLGSVGGAQAADSDKNWEIDSSVMYYSETDRVSLVEPVIRARKDLGNDEFLNLRLVVDTLTGASANGAIPTSSAQTFTTPSGSGTYVAGANAVPLDDSFLDTRVAISGEWEKTLGQTTRGIFGLNLSSEYDYQSIGIAGTFNFDYNQRNTTFTAGVSYNMDTVNPVGGAPVGLTAMPTFPSVKATQGDGLSKDVYDILLGVTQVMGRKDLMQFNLSYGNESGYLTDPYKILSVVDGTTGVLNSYVYEKRPEDRTRQAFFWRWSHQFEKNVLRLSYRYYTDDWGINSHTIDSHYRWELSDRYYLEPHLRFYTQTAADFYHTSLVNGATNTYASADYRLAELTSTTIGLKYGWLVGKDSEMGIRAEYITQQATASRVIGVQSAQDLLPDVNALLFQINYSTKF